jgi:uncharacterized protein (TIGR00730 family)
MADLADGFAAMPGGLGTFEEIFEILTWGQLGIHHKPSGFLNVAGYYDRLMQFLDHARDESLLRKEHRDMILTATTPTDLLEKMRTYASPIVEKWIQSDER